jgi:hypothetical protein
MSISPFARRDQSLTVDLKGINVMVGMPAGRDLHPLTVKSLMATQALCRDREVPFQMGLVIGSSVVQWARDEVIDVFLKSNATRLFWIDSDMTWEPDQFMRLLALSQYRDVLCGAYPAKMDQPTFYVNWDAAGGLVQREYGLIEIKGIGLGFAVISRKVIEELAAQAPKIFDEIGNREIAEVFRIGATDKNGRRCRNGEDMAFFADIRALGYKVWLDPEISLGHIGQKTYTGSIKDALVQA